MIRKLVYILLLIACGQAMASSGEEEPLLEKEWSFSGMYGTFDRQAIQRGFQVYQEVCSSCHSLNLLAYRNLTSVGFSENEVKAIAAQAMITDGPNDEGNMYERPGLPSDRFAAPFPNEKAARAANNSAYPVDLSLVVKARPHGANYIYSLLNGYEEAPEAIKMNPGMYYNKYFPGHQIAMAPPLSPDLVTYQDGTEATIDQMAYDIVNFLQWAAEPEMEKRKGMGMTVLLYLLIFTILFYMAKRIIWKRIK